MAQNVPHDSCTIWHSSKNQPLCESEFNKILWAWLNVPWHRSHIRSETRYAAAWLRINICGLTDLRVFHAESYPCQFFMKGTSIFYACPLTVMAVSNVRTASAEMTEAITRTCGEYADQLLAQNKAMKYQFPDIPGYQMLHFLSLLAVARSRFHLVAW